MKLLFSLLIVLFIFNSSLVKADCLNAYAEAIAFNHGRLHNQQNNEGLASLAGMSGVVMSLNNVSRLRAAGITALGVSLVLWMVGELEKSRSTSRIDEMQKLEDLMTGKVTLNEVDALVSDTGLVTNSENEAKVSQALINGFADNSFCPDGRAFSRARVVKYLKNNLSQKN